MCCTPVDAERRLTMVETKLVIFETPPESVRAYWRGSLAWSSVFACLSLESRFCVPGVDDFSWAGATRQSIPQHPQKSGKKVGSVSAVSSTLLSWRTTLTLSNCCLLPLQHQQTRKSRQSSSRRCANILRLTRVRYLYSARPSLARCLARATRF